jgi:hypothetical protein
MRHLFYGVRHLLDQIIILELGDLCPKFSTLVEREYQHHIVMKHPGKPGYPNMAVA